VRHVSPFGFAGAQGSSFRHQDRTFLPQSIATLLLLAVLCLSGPGAASALADGAERIERVKLSGPAHVERVLVTINKSVTLRGDRSFAEALVANPQIADAVPLTDHQLYLVGKKIGMTRLTLLDPEKRLIGVIEVQVSYDIEALREELYRTIPGGEFRLSLVNGRILLSGTVPDSLALSRAVAIARQFTSTGEEPAEPAAEPAAAGNASQSSQSGNGAAPAAPPPPAASGFINALKVRAPQQVLLEVRFVEAQRSAARELGFGWDVKGSRLALLTGTTGLISNGVPFGQFVARVLDNGTQADVLIQALESRGLARRLAEPNLVTLSGDTANFLAGGEFPFPVAQTGSLGASLVTIEFKKFGVGLAFTPTVLSGDQINLKIEPEVSDIDPNRTFSFATGLSVPGLIVRRASTTVELRDGQSFAIAGLLQTNHIKDDRQIPWLGQVPVLGTLFASASYRKEESDLVIIVTPRLVRPAVPGQKLATPLDRTLPANDPEFFLGRRMELEKQWGAPYGHILDLPPKWTTLVFKDTHDAPHR
jgi:pilus assembly protein CpaC